MIFSEQMTKMWCVGGRHYSITMNQNVYEKLNPKAQKIVKFIWGTLVFVVEIVHKLLLSKSQKEKVSIKKEDVKIGTIHQCQIQLGVI